MNAKSRNNSHRALFLDGGRLDTLLWGIEESNRQFAEARRELREKGFESLRGMNITICPCGCGLDQACDGHLETIGMQNEEIPW